MSKFKYSLVIAVLALFLIVLQGTVWNSVFPGSIAPNLVFVLVVFLSFFAPDNLGLYLAFAIGLALDFSVAMLAGPYAATFVMMYVILNALSQRLFLGTMISEVLVVFSASLFSNLVYLLLIYSVSPVGFEGIGVSLIESLLTAVFSPIVLFILDLIPGRKSGSDARV